MLVNSDLGFRVASWVCFLGFPLLFLLLRRKWRLYAARQDEIHRLVVLAAEEAARAELEAASIGYGHRPPIYPVSAPEVVLPVYTSSSSSNSSVSLHSSSEERFCAVCGRPTKTRCARCKSVRYCSGKCQIIHWRQGHNLECHPPEPSAFSDGVSVDCDVEKPEQIDSSSSSPQSERRQYATVREPAVYSSRHYAEKSSKKDDGDVSRPASGLTSIPGSSVPNASFSTENTCIEDSFSEDGCLHEASDEDCNGFACDEHVQTMQRNEPPSAKLLRTENESTRLSLSANKTTMAETKSRSHSSGNLLEEQSTSSSGFWDGSLDSTKKKKYVQNAGGRSSFHGMDNRSLSDSRPTLQFSFNLPVNSSVGAHQVSSGVGATSGQAALSQKVPTSVSRIRASKPPATEKRNTEDRKTQLSSKDPGNGFRSSIHGDVRSSRSSSRGRASSSPKVHAAAAVKSPIADMVHDNVTLPHLGTDAPPVSAVGLKTSMLKVVDQFRGAKMAKYYLPFGTGNDNLAKGINKGIFPYDIFVKLYHWDKMEFSPCGLVNCGNSCYANVVLQCLAFTPPLTAYFLQGLHSKACVNKDWCFSCEFERLILKAKEGRSALSPIGILSQIQRIGSHLSHGREEDAHEFLRHAVDSMQSICLREAGVSKPSSFVEGTTLVGLAFGGYIRSKIRCMRCHGKSERYERMMDLTVEIEGDIETLEEALQKFTMTESLDGENKYQCSRCKSYEKARKKLTIAEAPNILTVALKRFQSGKFGKLNKAIRFPEILDLAPYMRGSSDKSPIYRLYGAVVHLDVMNAAFSGHYVCYVRNAQNKWFKTDDSNVKPVSLDRVLKKGAYMLFYSRCSPRAPKSIRSLIVSREAMNKAKPNGEGGDPSRSSSYSRSVNIPNGHTNYDYVAHTVPRNLNLREVDSSSDNSSLFSHSDEVSTSTDTRESTSADDLSDYIFGDAATNGWNGRHCIHSSDSDASSSSSSSSSSSPLYTRHSPLSKSERNRASGHSEEGDPHPPRKSGSVGSPPRETDGNVGVSFLHSDSAKSGSRKVVVNSSGSIISSSSSSNSCRETDSGRVVGAPNPLENAKSSLHLRRPSRKRD